VARETRGRVTIVNDTTSAETCGLMTTGAGLISLFAKEGDSAVGIQLPGASSADRKTEVVSMDAAGHILVFVTFDDGGTAEILTAPAP
jgi:hypothetical protein